MPSLKSSLRGFWGHWITEKGCSMYMSFGLLSFALLCILLPMSETRLSLPLSIFVTLGCGSGFAWQIIKLRADETLALIPGKKKLVLNQGIALLTVTYSLFLIFAVALQRMDALFAAALGGVLSTWLILKVIKNTRYFKHVTSIYFLAAIGSIYYDKFDGNVTWLLLLAWLVMSLYSLTKLNNIAWSNTAIHCYKNGLNTGWSPLPTAFTLPKWAEFDKQLFPLSFFAGKTLYTFLGTVTLSSLAIPIIVYFLETPNLAIFIVLTISPIGIMFIRWSMLQNSRSIETLWVLPIFNNRQELHRAFVNRLLFVVTLATIIFWLSCLVAVAIQPNSPDAFTISQANLVAIAMFAGLISIFAISMYLSTDIKFTFAMMLLMNVYFIIIPMMISSKVPAYLLLFLNLCWAGLAILLSFKTIKRIDTVMQKRK
ncbi:ABC transporter permease protein [Pseudoalteromonas luteoviolacea B = ATCC 29581]|nr:ABC transporter permease protein [Pseudoalteromonas luteoviolacea B = ATCC 29581]